MVRGVYEPLLTPPYAGKNSGITRATTWTGLCTRKAKAPVLADRGLLYALTGSSWR